MTAQLELNLPYLEIKEVAGRKYLRENFKQTGRASYYIEFSKIKVRENFNKRVVFEDISELSDSIFVHGLKDPFVLDILPDGTAYIEEGHRRQKAIARLIEKGRAGWTGETMVEFFSNKNDVTELDRMVNQYTSNNNKKKLKPFEAAAVAYAAKFNFSEKPKSNEEVAELLGVSRQQVDNYIVIASADDLLKNEMLTADMNLTECVALIKNEKKHKKQTDKVEEDSHRNTAPPTPLPKDMLADELAELKELEQFENPEHHLEEETAETRIVNPELKEYESKPLDLVGNKIVNEKDENDVPGAKKFDEGREEIGWCQNLIKNLDWLSVQSEKLPEQTSKDFVQRCNWLMKDAELIRDWVSKNKKENKRGR